MSPEHGLLVAMPAAPPPDDVEQMSYEQARDELVTVVSRLEAGGETLEGSLALGERGEALAARCQQWLDGARARLEAARAPAGAPAGPDQDSARDRGRDQDQDEDEDEDGR